MLASTTVSGPIGAITPAVLTVTANDQSKVYGSAFSFAGSEFTATGLQNGESIGGVTLASAGAAAHVAGSPYAITAAAATGGTFVAADYTIAYVDGVFTVTPATLTIRGAFAVANRIYNATTSASIDAGDTLSLLGVVGTDAVTLNQVATFDTGNAGSAVAVSLAGSSLGGGNGDYFLSLAGAPATTATITPATLIITANDQSKGYLAGLPGLTVTYAGLQGADSIGGLSVTTTARAGSSNGDYAITRAARSTRTTPSPTSTAP